MVKRFDPRKLEKLNDPSRLGDLPPLYIWEKLNLENPDTLVDIGAGTGFFSVPFFKLMGQGQLYACDISSEMIAWMNREICPEYSGIHTVHMKDETIPLEDESADLVYMINLHHELEHPEKNLKEAYRVLKRGGAIFLADWKKEEMPYGPPVEHRISTQEVEEQLLKASFSLMETDNTLQKQFLIIARKK